STPVGADGALVLLLPPELPQPLAATAHAARSANGLGRRFMVCSFWRRSRERTGGGRLPGIRRPENADNRATVPAIRLRAAAPAFSERQRGRMDLGNQIAVAWPF